MMSLRPILLLSFMVFALAACGTPSGGPGQFDQAAGGSVALGAAEAAWKRNPDNVVNAVSYARALSEAGRYNRAAIILAPLAEGAGEKNASLRTQLSEIRSSLNSYDEALTDAKVATELAPDSARAQMALATAYDGLNKYGQAEAAYRKALQLSGGDDPQILNSLALNLASQGFIKDAVDMLQQASALAPGDRSIERNTRIVAALATQPKPFGWKNIQHPGKKPESVMQAKTDKKPESTPAVQEKQADTDVKSVEKSSESKKSEATSVPAPVVPIHNNN